MSFRFEDLTEEFFKKIVLFYFIKPNAHMDTAGGVIMVAEDGTFYLIDACFDGTGFEFPYKDYWEIFPLGPNENINSAGAFVESDGKWKRFERHAVREDYFDALATRVEELRKKDDYVFIPEVAVELLDYDYKLARDNEVVYEKSLEARARHAQEDKERAEHREKVRLRDSDVEWEEITSLGRTEGYRLVLARQVGSGSQIAELDYIEIQRAFDLGESSMSWNSPVEAYNLFRNEWHNVVDPIELGEGMHAQEDKGRFVRSFANLADAQAFALSRSDVNKENRVEADGVFTIRQRKLILTPDEQAERNLNEAERLTKGLVGCYFDAKRYLLRTDKLREDLSTENQQRLEKAWLRFAESTDRIKRGEEPLGV